MYADPQGLTQREGAVWDTKREAGGLEAETAKSRWVRRPFRRLNWVQLTLRTLHSRVQPREALSRW